MADHAGFCFGVQRAVDAASQELKRAKQDGVKLYCLGSLIHNKAVTEELEREGLVTIRSIEEAEPGSRVLIRAHGEPDSTYRAAEEKGIQICDETCPFVYRIHDAARKAGAAGRCVFVIGDPAHPEVIGILGSTDAAVGACDDPGQVKDFEEVLKDRPVTALAQTTLTREKFDACCEVLRQICGDLEIEDTICSATRQRQDAARKLAEESDAMVVIGDRSSSNSRKLNDICSKYCPASYFIEKFDDLPLQELKKYYKIGVAASASAPQQIILEVIANMSEVLNEQNTEMNEMLAYMDEIEKSLKLPGRGEVVTGTVVQVTGDYVVVNLGCKKDGMLPKEEVTLEEGQELTAAFKEGDEVQAKVIKTDDGDGNILLSKKKLQSGENWEEINAALESKEVVNVTVLKEVKGGVIAAYKEVSGFIPMSQLADHYVENAEEFIGKTLPVKVTRVDQRRNKAVFSHKAFLTEEKHKKIAEIWDTLNVGDVVEGKVMRFTDYGAFVDIGGIDGLLHISEISWGKLRHPQEALEIGQIVNVKILSMNPEKGKISLGLKQNAPEPWSVIDENYHEGDIVKGKVAQIKEYGAFVELAPGLDGLVHISEVAHKRVNKISDELQIGQEIDAKILEIDKEKRRISLSIKATLPQPTAEEIAAAKAAKAEEAEKAEEPAAEE
ncbi:MAG: bifunctional 4-hydroxy-3-methylbut-2-enyl diphosphate reductase/30S ribosomal protein S1 [Firmicutes bacterium]|nr:bifunctional 4-hydroxy-3-methylbut-2-enyl diphosphate reductase/30S ribosomal protein S1 [Bacillota bacterium]